MACDIEISFGDTATATTSGTGTPTDPILVTVISNPVGGSTSSVVVNADGSATHSDGAGVEVTIPAPPRITAGSATVGGNEITLTQSAVPTAISIDLCVERVGVFTGQRVGNMVIGCGAPDLEGGPPEALFPAAPFPEFWMQTFSGGITGSEVWVIENDPNGVPQWHRST